MTSGFLQLESTIKWAFIIQVSYKANKSRKKCLANSHESLLEWANFF
jgi:hypothetical protein